LGTGLAAAVRPRCRGAHLFRNATLGGGIFRTGPFDDVSAAAEIRRRRPCLRDHRDRLHRRAPPVGLPDRTACRAFPPDPRGRPRVPSGTVVSVGLVLAAHGDMGEELIRVARSLLGTLTLDVEAVSMPNDCDNGVALARINHLVDTLDTGDGVLVMTDLYGATPSNICGRLNALDGNVRRVSGLNLPMLMRVM